MGKMRQPNAVRYVRGVTLTELLIVVVIVAILASAAIPSYMAYVARSNRADAKAALYENAQFLERHFASHGFYSTAKDNEVAPALPVDSLPRGGGTETYEITAEVTNTTYTLTAAVKNSMSEDKCGNFVLAHTGAESVTGSAAVSECWNG